ncbi:MAG: chemotaxis response regulator protein-glutamate methylesterase [Bacillota bacterium]|jgi:two-component system chemotaxis response regulator CheB|nr:chemotaxis response regulator protein-glutamate methylesterase [Bacillota bacterium]HPZ54656.1 chemotaxis response regulator protein-glutamate methylesterase [Bacillota bacterium]HQD18908.1 chemotaxis response regulator protein-glutamate methylesterase [Bacillota bacterium]
MIRVLVVDDSAFMRKVISDIINEDPGMEVIGTARDGEEALSKIEQLKPDVVTLDVEMPKLNGIEVLRRIMPSNPVAVVMVSSLTREGADITIEALTLGAVDFVAKPTGAISVSMREMASELRKKIRAASLARLVGTSGSLLATLHHAEESLRRTEERLKRVAGRQQPASTVRVGSPSEGVVVIGSSTGGPSALQQVIPNLPESLPAGVLIVQHMPPGFTRSLAQRLAQMSRLKVSEARAGDKIEPGVALVAPGGYHMVVNRDKAVSLDTSPYVHGVRPAVDVTMESAARVFGNRCLGVVLTGMGTDGTRGASLIRRAGGKVIAQDEMTSVVYGMPRSVAQAGLADRILPIGDVAAAIAEEVQAT